jgi:hypothetical protein
VLEEAFQQLFGSLARIDLAMGGGWIDTADRMITTGASTPARRPFA